MTPQELEKQNELGVIDFLELFNEDFCEIYISMLMFHSETPACPHCGCINPYKTNRGWKCKSCNKKYTIRFGSVFENSKLPLRSWFFMIYQNSINKKNLSSIQYARNLGITQKSAWMMQNKIRYCLYQTPRKLNGIVEVDEAFVSKGNKWTRWGGITTRKAPIIGLIERGGFVIIEVIPDRKKSTMIEIIEKYVEKGSTIYTDGYAGYKNIKGYKHDFVEHSTREYVRGDVHTNTIENVWSTLKKSIRNAHHSVSEKHLQSYLDECAFKLNTRDMSQIEKFNLILYRCLSKEKTV